MFDKYFRVRFPEKNTFDSYRNLVQPQTFQGFRYLIKYHICVADL